MARSALNVLVGATITPLQKQLKKGVGLVKDFGAQASKAVAGSGGIGGAIAGLVGGVTVAAGLKMAISKYREAETAGARLTSTLKAGGNAAGVSTMQVVGFAKQMQATTGIAVSATMAAAAELGKVDNIKGPNFNEAIKQAANYAAVVGGDVTSASSTLAAALKNPREGYLELAAAGVRFSDAQIDALQTMQATGDMAGAQNVILEAMRAQYEGAAEAAGNTLDGSINKLWGSVTNLAATIGEALAPYLKAAVGTLTEWTAGLDTAATKNSAIEAAAVAVGWVVDGMQVLNAAWKAGEAIAAGLIAVLTTGFKWATEAVLYVVEALEMIPGTSKTSSAAIKGFLSEVKNFEDAAYQNTADAADEVAKAWAKPWASAKTDTFFTKVATDTKKTAAAMTELGSAVKAGPVAAMKQLSAEAIEAQKSATGMVREMKQKLETFGMDDWQSQAAALEKKGATAGQVGDVKKLGAQLKGKELAQSLETPFEKFGREMKKLSDLAAAGGIGGVDLERAKTALVSDLQGALPDEKISAGGPIMAGSQEARSALLSYQGLSRKNDPATQALKLQERQAEDQKLATLYLRKLATGGGGLLPAPAF